MTAPAAWAAPIPPLPSISLDELVAHAEMLTRIDRKYILERSRVPAVLAGLDPATRVLEIGGVRTQLYRSTYFDTPGLDSYCAAAHPRRRRFKVRTRIYADSASAFLEVKTRGPRGATVKERIPLPLAAARADDLTDAGRAWVGGRLAALGREPSLADRLRPVLHCSYRRATLAMPEGGRATLDTDLVWTDAAGARLDCPDLAIIETKSGSSPSCLDRLLWSHGRRPERVSKFATALAALHPDLPANRWARALRRAGLQTPRPTRLRADPRRARIGGPRSGDHPTTIPAVAGTTTEGPTR